MWLYGVAAAAEAPPTDSFSETLVVAGGTVLVALITGVVSIVIQIINSKNRTGAAPPAPNPVGVETADLRRRADDNDERDDVQDRRHNRTEAVIDRHADRLERIEWFLDNDTPGWRRHDT